MIGRSELELFDNLPQDYRLVAVGVAQITTLPHYNPYVLVLHLSCLCNRGSCT
jgi:hypothetical protein